MVPARRDVPEPGDGRDVGVGYQRCTPVDAAEPRRKRHRPAVDRRFVCDRVRRAAAVGRGDRRSFRPQAGVDGWPRGLRRRLAHRCACGHVERRDPVPSRRRHRSCVRHAGNAQSDRGDLPSAGAGQGHCDLGRIRRCGRCTRPTRRRVPPDGLVDLPVVLVGVGVRRQRRCRARRADRRRGSSLRGAGTTRPHPSIRSVRCCRSSASAHCCSASSRVPPRDGAMRSSSAPSWWQC